MTKIYSYTEREGERYKVICDLCDRCVYPNHDRINHFRGFKCLDTGFFICADCKESYYIKKNAGEFGEVHKHKYSEVPVVVPWIIVPTNFIEPIIVNNQYKLEI
jgi:hypothetical protein